MGEKGWLTIKMFKKVMPGTTSRLCIVDHTETYGRHILARIVKKMNVERCVDLGCGNGDDLLIVKKFNPKCKLIGVDFSVCNREKLINKGIEPIILNIEKQVFPFEDDTIDLIIANQVLEHTKEIFWINHEIFRTLKVGGYLFLGVPNVLSLHNRILSVLGVHPTCAKMISAHVRVFSKNDIYLFYKVIAKSFTSLVSFYGSQFYPFPIFLARRLASILPSQAFSIFFLIKKIAEYKGEFINWILNAQLETNFYTGDDK